MLQNLSLQITFYSTQEKLGKEKSPPSIQKEESLVVKFASKLFQLQLQSSEYPLECVLS